MPESSQKDQPLELEKTGAFSGDKNEKKDKVQADLTREKKKSTNGSKERQAAKKGNDPRERHPLSLMCVYLAQSSLGGSKYCYQGPHPLPPHWEPGREGLMAQDQMG